MNKNRGVAQLVERVVWDHQAAGSSPVTPTRKRQIPTGICRFQLNPPLRVGEILLRNVKFSLRSNEIAAAVGGFNFI